MRRAALTLAAALQPAAPCVALALHTPAGILAMPAGWAIAATLAPRITR